MPKKKKNYYPNNWRQYANSPDEWFQAISYEDFLDWKLSGWELPSSVACIVRCTDLKTKKTSEYIYQRAGCARNKVKRLIDKGNVEITVVDNYDITHLLPEEIYDEIYE